MPIQCFCMSSFVRLCYNLQRALSKSVCVGLYFIIPNIVWYRLHRYRDPHRCMHIRDESTILVVPIKYLFFYLFVYRLPCDAWQNWFSAKGIICYTEQFIQKDMYICNTYTGLSTWPSFVNKTLVLILSETVDTFLFERLPFIM